MAEKPPRKDMRGTPKGHSGNIPHQRSEEAATLIRELSGYGMPQEEISRVLNAAFGSGYSVDTLDRHYRAELDAALAERKAQLLRRAHKIAMAEDVPDKVTADAAYKESATTVKWLLGAVHRVRDGTEHDFGAGTINVNITTDDAEL